MAVIAFAREDIQKIVLDLRSILDRLERVQDVMRDEEIATLGFNNRDGQEKARQTLTKFVASGEQNLGKIHDQIARLKGLVK